MPEPEYQIRFYRDINNLSEYIVLQNESLLNEFKKERAQHARPSNSFFFKKYLHPYFGNAIPLDQIQDNSYIVVYEFSYYSDGDANIYEKRLRLV